MIPGSFDYHSPSSLEDAIKLLDDLGEDAKILAGVHSLIPMMKWRLAEPTHLIDISKLSGMDYIVEKDGYLCIGAMTRETALETSSLIIEKFPILKDIQEGGQMMGFLDVVLRNKISGRIVIIDLKTATRGWTDFQKKDFNKKCRS